MSSVVPEGWTTSRIQEVVLKVIDNRGKTPPLSDSGYNLIEVACVRDDKQFLDYEKITKCVSEDTYQTWFRNGHPKVGDTIVPTVGSIGEFAFVRENRGCIAQNLVALRPSAVIEPLFLYFQCYSEVVQNNISRILMGAVQPSLRVPHFLETSLLLPPLPEQKKIASILTSVDEVIENTQKQIDKLQDLKKATMNELLTKGIGHTEFKDSELGRIPKSWEVVTLSEIILSLDGGVSVNGQQRPANSAEVGVLKVSCVKQGRFIPSENKVIEDYDRSRAKLNPCENTILISRANTPELVGESGYVERTRNDLFLPDKIWALRLNDSKNVDMRWLSSVLTNGETRRSISDAATGTSSSMRNISKANLLQIKISLPPVLEQIKISRILRSLDAKRELFAGRLNKVKTLKKSLMQDLLTGKVRVTVN
jgi:type I restriction enzyme S subunit